MSSYYIVFRWEDGFLKKKVSYPNGDVNNGFNMVVSNKHFLNSSKGIQKRQIWKVRTHVLKHHDYLPKFWVDEAREGGCTDSIRKNCQNFAAERTR